MSTENDDKSPIDKYPATSQGKRSFRVRDKVGYRNSPQGFKLRNLIAKRNHSNKLLFFHTCIQYTYIHIMYLEYTVFMYD